MSRSNLLAFLASTTVTTVIFAMITLLSLGEWFPVWRFIALAIMAHVPYAFYLFKLNKNPSMLSPFALVAAALFLRLLLVPGMPVLSDDVYRYAWDGSVMANGISPFSYAPSDHHLEHLRNENWGKINNKDLRTIYPPGAQYVFAAIAFVSPSVYLFKLVAAFTDTGIVILLLILTSDGRKRRFEIWPAAAYGLNPLACIETGMSGHLEPLAILPMLAAIYVWHQNSVSKKSTLSSVVSSAFLAFAAMIKLLPALLLLILGRNSKNMWVAFLLFVTVLCLPFIWEKQNLIETLDTFGRRWEGNAGIFALVKEGIYFLIGFFSSASGPDDPVHLSFMDSFARAVQGTFFSMHKNGGFDPMKPGAFGRHDLALVISKLISLIALMIIIIVAIKEKFDPIRFCLFVFGAVIILTPVLHAWYLLWVLPFAAMNRAWPWFVFAATLPLSSIALDRWWAIGEWNLPYWVQIVEWGALAAATLVWLKTSTDNTKIKDSNTLNKINY